MTNLEKEQEFLLRECRAAIDSLLAGKPLLAAAVHGSTSLGNLRAMLFDYKENDMQPIQAPPAPEPTAERVAEARRIVTEHQKGSISLVQRVMRCRYVEAAMLLEELERIGIVGPMLPTGGRQVLVAV